MSVPLPGELAAERHAVDDPAGQLVQGLSSGVAPALIAQLPATGPGGGVAVLAGLDVEQVARILGKRPGRGAGAGPSGLAPLAKRLERARQRVGLVRAGQEGVTR
jgi:hypothetical protein